MENALADMEQVLQNILRQNVQIHNDLLQNTMIYNQIAEQQKTRIFRERLGNPDTYAPDLVIYDVGMHNAQDTSYYLKKGFRVVAIEANPILCQQACSRFADEIANKRLTIINAGIARETGELDFFVNEQISEWSSFIQTTAGRGGHPLKVIQVRSASMTDIIAIYGAPYYVKIDIEGHDHIALEQCLDQKSCIPYISVENGFDMLNLLRDHSYSGFKYIQQNNITNVEQVFPPLEGHYVHHIFERGASGLFGEDTPGPWLDYEQALYCVSKVWDVRNGMKNPNWDDNLGGWFDLHARHTEYAARIRELVEYEKP